MRLISVIGRDSSLRARVSASEFHDDAIPPYAILSHTWGPATGEISYQRLTKGFSRDEWYATSKDFVLGLRKMHLCSTQASKDGLRWYWIDTCCINKESSSELSEAINSMFAWYRNAARCYVFLSDVSHWVPTEQMLCQFRNSRWFSRGWTLQELIAPREVDFFTVEGRYIGSKSTMTHLLSEVTGIPIKALLGEPLERFSIEERLSWARGRQTTRREDRAYSLQGLFDIHMPLLYGEKDKAMDRLLREIITVEEFKRKQKPALMEGSVEENDSTEPTLSLAVLQDFTAALFISEADTSEASVQPETTPVPQTTKKIGGFMKMFKG